MHLALHSLSSFGVILLLLLVRLARSAEFALWFCRFSTVGSRTYKTNWYKNNHKEGLEVTVPSSVSPFHHVLCSVSVLFWSYGKGNTGVQSSRW